MQYNFDEYADRVIQRYKLKRKSPNEFSEQPCPHCGGTDRFWISNFNGELKHHCRQNCDPLERLKAMKTDGALPEFYYDTEPLYFHKKRIPLLGPFRQYSKTVVRLVNVKTNKFAGHQIILPSGIKILSKGLVKEGAGAFIDDPSEKLYVWQGWATAVTFHISTGEQALFALDAKTLLKTVKLLKHPDIVIAAYNDDEGITAAKATALPFAMPEREDEDWWDVSDRDGKEAVKAGLSSTHKRDFLEGFLITDGVELHNQNFKELVFLKKGFLPFPNLVLTAVAPKTGKSWFLLRLAEELTQNDYTVVYISNEDTTRRLQARYKKVSDFPIKKLMFISDISSNKPLLKGEAGQAFISALKRQYPDLK